MFEINNETVEAITKIAQRNNIALDKMVKQQELAISIIKEITGTEIENLKSDAKRRKIIRKLHKIDVSKKDNMLNAINETIDIFGVDHIDLGDRDNINQNLNEIYDMAEELKEDESISFS